MRKDLVLFVLLSLMSISLSANEYVVIANEDMKKLSKSQIKAIFLKKILYIDDLKIVALNLQARDLVRKRFEKELLHMSFQRLKKYWMKQHYLGHRPPITLKSQNSVKAFVKKVVGAVGYIEAKNLDDNLKVIYRWRD